MLGGLAAKALSSCVGPQSDIVDWKTLAKAYCELGQVQDAVGIYQKLSA